MTRLYPWLISLLLISTFLSFPLPARAQNTPYAGSRIASATTEPSQFGSHERFATFFADKDFKSQLLIENLRLDVPVTVTPALITQQGEVPLQPIILSLTALRQWTSTRHFGSMDCRTHPARWSSATALSLMVPSVRLLHLLTNPIGCTSTLSHRAVRSSGTAPAWMR